MHKHHVIPRHEWKVRFGNLRGFNAPDNVVYLTIDQHAQAHQLLYELNNNQYDYIAWKTLSGQIDCEEAIRLAGIAANKGRKKPYVVESNIRRRGEKRSMEWIEMIKKQYTGVPKSEAHKAAMRGKRPHIIQTGAKNNAAKRIQTPFGEFGSMVDAARTLGMSYTTLQRKLYNNCEGWRFL